MQFGPRTLFSIVLLLAMPIAAYMFMFKPLNEQKMHVIEDTQQKQEQLNGLTTALARTRDLPGDIEKLRKAIAFLEAKLPQEKEMDGVLREVWQIAEKNGLNTKSVRSLKPVQSASYCEQPIKMVIVGPFAPGFFNFLRDVEQLPRLTRINEMHLLADDKNSGVISAEVVLTIYFEAGQKVAVAK
jgi:type IV pilus assembly protein PilO